MRIHKRLLDIVEPTPQDRRLAAAPRSPAGVDIEIKQI